MNHAAFSVGTVVESTAGRDAGRLMVITGICDDESVLVCDGKLRKIAAPKKKKIKHLRFIAETDEETRLRIQSGQASDNFIRRTVGSMAIDDDLI